MNYTEHYNLNQWEASDKVLREDFNADNAKLDAVLAEKGNCLIAVGSYTGSGTYGVNSPNVLTFPFRPLAVFFSGGVNSGVLVAGVAEHIQRFGQTDARWNVTWDGNTVSWYLVSSSSYAGSSLKMSPDDQFNSSGRVYFYTAIGAADD